MDSNETRSKTVFFNIRLFPSFLLQGWLSGKEFRHLKTGRKRIETGDTPIAAIQKQTKNRLAVIIKPVLKWQIQNKAQNDLKIFELWTIEKPIQSVKSYKKKRDNRINESEASRSAADLPARIASRDLNGCSENWKSRRDRFFFQSGNNFLKKKVETLRSWRAGSRRTMGSGANKNEWSALHRKEKMEKVKYRDPNLKLSHVEGRKMSVAGRCIGESERRYLFGCAREKAEYSKKYWDFFITVKHCYEKGYGLCEKYF